ncbi:MAG: hypothetical protein M3Q07_10370 [Pseudobdellovibrionaceae bacterium]|nr:hypothetical protein [Pseudobdellovibrionaceae bacterium]
MNMKNPLIAMALLAGPMSILSADEVSPPGPPLGPVEADPLLTEKSLSTFKVDFSGLTVTLPKELKERAKVNVKSDQLAEFFVGSIDVSFSLKNPEGEGIKIVKGWIDFQGIKKPCTAEKHLENLKKAYDRQDGFYYTLTEVRNENFTGYISRTENFKAGSLKGINYALVDDGKGTCYNLSVAPQDFDGFTFDEIRKALTPLTIGLEQSLKTYTQSN